MLIQNISNAAQAAQPVGRIDDAPRVVADAPDIALVKQAPSQQPSPAQLKSAVDNMNHAMQQANQSLEFSIDTTTKRPVVRLVDTSTGTLISQFPTEQALAIAHSIDQYQQGLLLRQKA